uniref:Uncharacterized protein n=1 Tax=Proboscia inermis TaxID=420281 RepID=A0A7S0CL98_9STRA|mmetsp:Transcript_6635/g.6816  ORF Transcript_6635/g.6816 Transcript_6635/m.6816 type:complete len:110 (+) Transcript_6635:142-471(+)
MKRFKLWVMLSNGALDGCFYDDFPLFVCTTGFNNSRLLTGGKMNAGVGLVMFDKDRLRAKLVSKPALPAVEDTNAGFQVVTSTKALMHSSPSLWKSSSVRSSSRVRYEL